jgi:hypothetical protein
LVPGTTYYVKLVALDSSEPPNRSAASSEVTVVAGYTTPAAMQPRVSFDTTPPNHNFEAANTSGAPPDRWTDEDAVWNTRFLLDTSVVKSGKQSLKVAGTTVGTYEFWSDYFPVNASLRYASRVWFRNNTTGVDAAPIDIYFYDASLTLLGSTSLINTYFVGGVYNDVWQNLGNSFSPTAGALYARVLIQHVPGAAAYTTHYDEVVVEPITDATASYSRATTQAIANNTITIIDFATKTFDNFNAVTTGASWKFTAPVGGVYQVEATAALPAEGSAGGVAELWVYKNGAVYRKIDDRDASVFGDYQLGGSTLVKLVTGDTVDIRIRQNNGGSRSIPADSSRTHVSIAQVSDDFNS